MAYPLSRKNHPRPSNSNSPSDAILGGPAAIDSVADELEALVDDVLDARTVNSNYSSLRAALQAIWTAIGGKASSSSVVSNTGDETVGGVKTFSSIPVAPASDPTTSNQLARKAYVDSVAGAGVSWGSSASSLTFGQSPSAGSAGSASRSDHTHGMPSSPSGGLPGDWLDVTEHGVVRDCKTIRVTTTTGASATTITWTGPNPNFTSDDIGKKIRIGRALADNSDLVTTITGVTSPSVATIASPATAATNGLPVTSNSEGEWWLNALVGTDNTAAINAIFNNLPAGKRVIYFPGGTECYWTDGGHTLLDKNVISIVGDDMFDVTNIITSHPTNSIFRMAGCHNVLIEKLSFYHFAGLQQDADYAGGVFSSGFGMMIPEMGPNFPTAGAAIETLVDPTRSWSWQHKYQHITISGMHSGIIMNNLSQARVHDVNILKVINNGFYYDCQTNPDWGGFYLTNCMVSSSRRTYNGLANTCVTWRAGGGVLISECEFAGSVRPVLIEQMGTNITYGTSQIRVIGCSIEDMGWVGIHIKNDRNPSGPMKGDMINMVVANNNIASALHGGSVAIRVESTNTGNTGRTGSATNSIGGIVISGNSGYMAGYYGIQLVNVSYAAVSGNIFLSAQYGTGTKNSATIMVDGSQFLNTL
jgi:hypothetical protein